MNIIQFYHPTILSLFANPYGISYIKDPNQLKGLLIAYEDNVLTQEFAAQAIFGGIGITGELPVSTAPYYQKGYGI